MLKVLDAEQGQMTMTDIWQPITLGRATLPNRFVMAPMTRSRAQYDGTPGPLAAEYYAQRASVGLIVAEGTQPSDDGKGTRRTLDWDSTSRLNGMSREELRVILGIAVRMCSPPP
ncbi:hypothetical protein GHA01_23030 [Novacetimonas hansenii]|uniref:NADH:flavin oxidoreductase/NADH oxidase N-terminal domain-containing protein n=2 Tax=Novacetimonas hansenii TaxID=436 RepID=A0ABQ0SGH9_NOVHA|nr:NADH:flavin oxidoreductase/NADH oxidase [Novacetimonas hansenii JCM 7643]GBQ59941.1 hypothetical protein AA0243_2185 [Novacetimonas hansenii NRIC 0243]GEC64454.1 hypothetical protein GHA01_23030 [Novacetimonas hansenii]